MEGIRRHQAQHGLQGRFLRLAPGTSVEVMKSGFVLGTIEHTRNEKAHASTPPLVQETHPEEPSGWRAAHARSPWRRVRKPWTARCRLLFTVPRLRSRVCAISSRLSSW